STESGIPDYRGPLSRARPRNPVQIQEFVRSPDARRRFWARSTVGWARFRDAQPNGGHRALAALEAAGFVRSVITQNVDRLHARAGSGAVIELHGALHRTRCLGCGDRASRDDLQARILASNRGFAAHGARLAPDGDVDLPDEVVARFEVPACAACGGVLRPDVVMFGEAVPRDRVERAFAEVDAAGALLVVGSSLAVFSGYRFVLRAHERGLPIAIVNLGETRADGLATLRVEGRAGEVLTSVARALGAGGIAAE
ncbi:MAG TPA: NAD-dependent protein deacetylase, partial [Myxococcales bacterium]|nr:NAD-dependent protein deacetylase [Myxococcales bacterium]